MKTKINNTKTIFKDHLVQLPWHGQGHLKQRDLVKDVPVYGRGVGLDHLSRSLPTKTVLWLYWNIT